MTISFVREYPYWPLDSILVLMRIAGAASFTIYSSTKDYCSVHNILSRHNIIDVSLTGGISGAMSGSLISFGSARKGSAYFA